MAEIKISPFKLKSYRIVYQISYKPGRYKDQYISSLINMSFKKYRKWLMENFNGVKYDNYDNIFFLNELDAQRALDGINSILLVNQLCEVKQWN